MGVKPSSRAITRHTCGVVCLPAPSFSTSGIPASTETEGQSLFPVSECMSISRRSHDGNEKEVQSSDQTTPLVPPGVFCGVGAGFHYCKATITLDVDTNDHCSRRRSRDGCSDGTCPSSISNVKPCNCRRHRHQRRGPCCLRTLEPFSHSRKTTSSSHYSCIRNTTT